MILLKKLFFSIKEWWLILFLILIIVSIAKYTFKKIDKLTSPVIERTHLSISLQNRTTGTLLLQNTGNLTVKITTFEIGNLQTSCQYFTEPDIRNINDGMLKKAYQALSFVKYDQIQEVERIKLSPGEIWKRKALTKIIPDGIFCAFEMPIKVEFSFASGWINQYLKIIRQRVPIDLKYELYMRHDGCQYSLMSKKAYTDKEIQSEYIIEKLLKCVGKRYPQYIKLRTYLKDIKKMQLEPIRKNIKLLSDKELIEYVTIVRRQLKRRRKRDDVNLCYLSLLIYDEIKERPELTLWKQSMRETLNSCLGIRNSSNDVLISQNLKLVKIRVGPQQKLENMLFDTEKQ